MFVAPMSFDEFYHLRTTPQDSNLFVKSGVGLSEPRTSRPRRLPEPRARPT